LAAEEQARDLAPQLKRLEIEARRKAAWQRGRDERELAYVEALAAAERLAVVARCSCTTGAALKVERAVHEFRRAADRARPRRKVA